MKVKFLDISKEDKPLKERILQAVEKHISQSQFVLGNTVENFEKSFARYTGAKYCVGVASGTDAILLCLRAFNVGTGDEVIVPAMTFIGSVSPIILLGAKPVIVDIDKDSYT